MVASYPMLIGRIKDSSAIALLSVFLLLCIYDIVYIIYKLRQIYISNKTKYIFEK